MQGEAFRSKRKKVNRSFFLSATIISLTLMLLLQLWQARGLPFRNLGNHYALRAALISSGYVKLAEQTLTQAVAAGQAKANKTLGFLAKWQGNDEARQEAQSALILSVPQQIYFLSLLERSDHKLAKLAIRHYPQSPEALAWRAAQLEQSDPEQAIELYQQALTLNPSPYNWWLGLGHALEELAYYEAALEAYDIGCQKMIGIIPCHERGQVLNKIK